MVNAGALPCPFEGAVSLFGPLFAPRFKQCLVVPIAVFLAESIGANVAHG
jgi:hypothetical protein